VNTILNRESESWEFRLERLLPLFGHRNWIVVADAAYPAQSKPGIETIFTGRDHTEVLGRVLDAISASRHVRANIYLDAELKPVAEADALGVNALRSEMTRKLAGKNTRELAHEQIIARLDQAGNGNAEIVANGIIGLPHNSPSSSI
jgi:L-fucose mutarotase/ribose pyranase (RbsD/FucU family)